MINILTKSITLIQKNSDVNNNDTLRNEVNNSDTNSNNFNSNGSDNDKVKKIDTENNIYSVESCYNLKRRQSVNLIQKYGEPSSYAIQLIQ